MRLDFFTIEGAIFISLVLVAILIAILLILNLIEKKFKKKLGRYKGSKNLFYTKKIKKLRGSKEKTEKILDFINDLARDFFKEAFDLDYNLDYSKLIEEFTEKENKECVDFCNLISKLNYSGEKIEEKEIKLLLESLNDIVKKNDILSLQKEKFEKGKHKKGKRKKVRQRKIKNKKGGHEKKKE